MRSILLPAILFLASVCPLASPPAAKNLNLAFPGWPATFEGAALEPLPLSAQERTFGADFPGVIARFRAGTREIIIRWVSHPTRMLHPSADCLKGAGYAVSPLPLRRDKKRRTWNCNRAHRDNRDLQVCELIFDEEGGNWSDTSSWYWAAMLGKTQGPWWAVTASEPMRR